MKITIIGGGNMGSAIAFGLADGNKIAASDITVIDSSCDKTEAIKLKNPALNTIVGDYAAVSTAKIIILAVKPWMIEDVAKSIKSLINPEQIILSIAAGISLSQLVSWVGSDNPIYKVIPNTAIAVRQSMTFITSLNAAEQHNKLIENIFNELGQAMFIEEKQIPAVTSLSSCGIAFVFRYIRASMEGGVEMGIYPNQGKEILLQTLRGAVELLETNKSHPEEEIDKVTTPGGITIKGLNEMEHNGFTSSVIKGLLASYVKE